MLINVTGPAMARRGDRIRCTVLFEEEPDEDGKIPVFFTLNGRKIVLQSGESRFLMDFKKPLFPFIGMTKGSSVLTKVRTSRTPTSEAGGVLPYITYTGMCLPTGSWF